MSQTAHPGGHTAPATPTGWVGWIWFAGVMMIILGAFNAVSGLVALFRPTYYVSGENGVLVFNFTGWGWIHLIVGILAALAGIVLFTGAFWARVTAVILVGINALAQLAFLGAYPVWSALIIALDVLVIWAIVVHGSEIEESRRAAV